MLYIPGTIENRSEHLLLHLTTNYFLNKCFIEKINSVVYVNYITN